MYQTRLLNRKVYGGGGILPDLFVPIDTTFNSKTFHASRKGLCSRYALEQVDARRAEGSSRHSDEDDFVANMNFTDAELDAFKSYVGDEGVEIDEEEWSRSLPAIE